jgi:hypothetical protein
MLCGDCANAAEPHKCKLGELWRRTAPAQVAP